MHLDRTIFRNLVDQLKPKLGDIRNYRGGVHKALCIVSNGETEFNDIHPDIGSNNSREQDINILISCGISLPLDDIRHSPQGIIGRLQNFLTKSDTDSKTEIDSYATVLIMIAFTLVGLRKRPDSAGYHTASSGRQRENFAEQVSTYSYSNSQHDISEEPVRSQTEKCILGLVIKSSDLSDMNLSVPKSLKPDEVQELLMNRADYYLCTTQKRMEDKLPDLSLNSRAIDYNSDQHVVLSIEFSTTMPLHEEIINKTKIGIRQYLKSSMKEFVLTKVAQLEKVSNLHSLGFHIT